MPYASQSPIADLEQLAQRAARRGERDRTEQARPRVFGAALQPDVGLEERRPLAPADSVQAPAHARAALAAPRALMAQVSAVGHSLSLVVGWCAKRTPDARCRCRTSTHRRLVDRPEALPRRRCRRGERARASVVAVRSRARRMRGFVRWTRAFGVGAHDFTKEAVHLGRVDLGVALGANRRRYGARRRSSPRPRCHGDQKRLLMP